MTITDIQAPAAYDAPPVPAHPLASLSAAEIEAVLKNALGFEAFVDTIRIANVGHEEPANGEVIAGPPFGHRLRRPRRHRSRR